MYSPKKTNSSVYYILVGFIATSIIPIKIELASLKTITTYTQMCHLKRLDIYILHKISLYWLFAPISVAVTFWRCEVESGTLKVT